MESARADKEFHDIQELCKKCIGKKDSGNLLEHVDHLLRLQRRVRRHV